jgi:hypothetical protein
MGETMQQVIYIRRLIERLTVQQPGIQEAFAKEARDIDAAIEALILASSNGPQIVALRLKREAARTQHTAKLSNLSGQIEALTELFNRYHQNPVPPGTVVHGIDVSVLDWETRERVLAGDAETVAVLGGTTTPVSGTPMDVETPAEGEPPADADPTARPARARTRR